MPRNFPDLSSLERAAKSWNFRGKHADEDEAAYRRQLADHVQPKDLVESMEIRTGHGWDQFNPEEQLDMVQRSARQNPKS